MDRLAVEEGAVALHRVKELLAGRIEHDADDRLPPLDQRRRHRPFRDMAEEGVGAVDWVDHPYAVVLEPLRLVLGFLREPAIIGPCAFKGKLKRGIDGKVRLAHLGSIALPLYRDLLPEKSEGERARILHRFLEERIVRIERRRGFHMFHGCHRLGKNL
jgi:hypothetical protein